MRSRLCNIAFCLPLIASAMSHHAYAQGRYGGHSFSSFEPPIYSSPSDANSNGIYQPQKQFSNESPMPAEAYAMSSPSHQYPQQQVSAFPDGLLRLNSTMTRPLLDFVNRQSEKEVLLMSQDLSSCTGPEITVGAQFRASGMVGHTNTANKFPYQGRFPGDFVGNTVTDARLLQANQAIVGHFTPWAHGYMETLFSDVFSFPTFAQGSFQMRQAYVTFGDLSQAPLYAWIGKKNVNFGDMGTLSPFSQSMVWHYFAPLAEGAGVGYSQNGLSVNLTALNGSRGVRVVDSEEKGHINNFAANMRYEIPLANNVTWAIGGGYLNGTIYNAAVAEHTNPNVIGPMSGAWDANTQMVFGPWIFEGEIARTINAWPATAAKVTAWKAEAAHDFAWTGRPLRLSGSYSEGIQGPVGSEFEFNRQFVAGLRYIPHPNVTMSLEYVQSTGFAPLIDITTVSDRNVIQDSVILGLVLAI